MDTDATNPASAPAVLTRGVRTRVGAELLHDGLDLEVRRGEVVGLVGASGSGKSVLLREILGLRRPDGGRIEVLGRDVTDEAPELRRRWGVLFQEGGLFSALTVGDNVRAPIRELTDFPPGIVDEIVRVKLSMVGLPPDAAAKFPSELSGGMKRRAGLARALALDPELLILDEPTTGLDPIGAEQIDDLIASLKRTLDLTVLMATHDLDTLTAICDRVVVLVDGRAVMGTVAELRESSHPWIREYFCGPRGRRPPTP